MQKVLSITPYNPHITFIAEIANIFQEPPLVAYRRPKSLRDILVSTKLKSKTTRANNNKTGSCGPCSKPICSWCSRINETSTFIGTQDSKVFNIFHTVNCQSTRVIFIIECKICKLQYLGKSETGFNLRLNNHRNHIKKGVSSCELIEHFLHNTRTQL